MFAIIGAIVGFIWDGITAATAAIVQFLQWAVTALWAFATATYNALLALTGKVLEGFRKAWDFLRLTYDDVLKPAWLQFWKIIDRVRGILQDVFGPVLKFLRTVRDYVLAFYKRFVRPVLDVLDAVRQVLRVLEALHVKFAQQLDAAIGRLEALIDRPFRFVLEKLNEVINVVNRVITADGLFQRLALVRSLQRDVALVGRVLVNPLMGAPSEKQSVRLANAWTPQPAPDLHDQLAAYLRGESNDSGDVIDAAVAAAGDYWQTLGGSEAA